MKIATQGRIVTATSLGTIVLACAVVAWARWELAAADQQRLRAGEITRALSDLRLVTFEYILHRPERARLQEMAAAEHLQRLLLAARPNGNDAAADALSRLKARAEHSQRLFIELAAQQADRRGPDAPAQLRLASLLGNRLLLDHHESTADAVELVDHAHARIDAALRRLQGLIAAGVVLVGATTLAAAWLIHRRVLAPLQRVQTGTREVAAGNLEFRLDLARPDEIGELARQFDAMTAELKHGFAQVERSNRELTALNKEMESFSYSVSHDLRAPLRSMDGFSLALLEDHADKLDDDARADLMRIRLASQRMGRLIDELLSLARVTRTELTMRPVDLSALGTEIAGTLQQRQPDRRIDWRIEPGIVVRADPALMRIALQNLLENAWKFTARVDEPVIRLGETRRDGERVFFVSDNGAGFDMQHADRLFGAFQRLHHESEFPGTGVGLATVQRIVHRHDGAVWAWSEPGRGATFHFTLRESADERPQQGDPPRGGQPG